MGIYTCFLCISGNSAGKYTELLLFQSAQSGKMPRCRAIHSFGNQIRSDGYSVPKYPAAMCGNVRTENWDRLTHAFARPSTLQWALASFSCSPRGVEELV